MVVVLQYSFLSPECTGSISVYSDPPRRNRKKQGWFFRCVKWLYIVDSLTGLRNLKFRFRNEKLVVRKYLLYSFELI